MNEVFLHELQTFLIGLLIISVPNVAVIGLLMIIFYLVDGGVLSQGQIPEPVAHLVSTLPNWKPHHHQRQRNMRLSKQTDLLHVTLYNN